MMDDAEAMRRHNRAMALTHRAIGARDAGDKPKALRLFQRALLAERDCAEAFAERLDFEPTRSILYRSAATLALDAEDHAEAIRLAQTGLDGNPPAELADELQEVADAAAALRESVGQAT